VNKDKRKPETICKDFETPGIRDILKMVISEEHSYFALVNYTKSIILIVDLPTTKVIHTLEKFCLGYVGRMESKSAVFYSPKILAICWSNRDVFFIDIDSDKIVKKFTGPFENQNSIQFTENKKNMVTCANHGEIGIDSTKASVCIWDVDT